MENFDLPNDLDLFPDLQAVDFSCNMGGHAAPIFHETYQANKYDLPVNIHGETDQVESAGHVVATVNQ